MLEKPSGAEKDRGTGGISDKHTGAIPESTGAVKIGDEKSGDLALQSIYKLARQKAKAKEVAKQEQPTKKQPVEKQFSIFKQESIKKKKFRGVLAPLHAKYAKGSVAKYQAKDPQKWRKTFAKEYYDNPEIRGKKYMKLKDVKRLQKRWEQDLRKSSLGITEKDKLRRKIKALKEVPGIKKAA